MRRLVLLLLIAIPFTSIAEDKKPPTTLRDVLLEQLRTTHDQEDWFVPVKIAVAGLTAEQAKWSPGKGNHSVGQLAYHIWYWNNRQLIQFKGGKPGPPDANNNETFDKFDDGQWDDLVKKLDQVMSDWETAVRGADDEKLARNASVIAHIGAHTAYHVGQILYVRKLHGAWDPSKGVQ